MTATLEPLAGHNRFTNQALSSLARMAAADAFGVAPAEVRVDFRDENALLALNVVSPIQIPGLSEFLSSPQKLQSSGGTLWDRAVGAKASIMERVTELSGVEISRVDVRISGIASPKTSRRVQ